MDQRSLNGSNNRMREEFKGVFPIEKVDEVFLKSAADLANDARVDTFVPLLAERRTRALLKSSSG